jgi:2'-5' RNA ligase
MESTLRAFIAIDLSPEVRRWLVEARALLEGKIPGGAVRWTDPDGIHVTLKFLGDTPAGRIGEIRSAMERAAEGFRPFPLAVAGLGCFPDTNRPRVMWAGVRRQDELIDLQKRLEDGLERIGFPRERRAFSPHLTLARVRDGVTGGERTDIGRAVAAAAVESTAMMEVTGLCLFKSVLRPSGAEYSVLHRTAFLSAAGNRSAGGLPG